MEIKNEEDLKEFIRDEIKKTIYTNLDSSKTFQYINELEEKLKIATAMLTRGTYPGENNDFDKHYISKNKVIEIINALKLVNENKEFGASYSDYEEAISKIEKLINEE